MSEQRIVLGDCLDVFRDVRGLQAIVTDPPAGISFMSKKWDSDRGGRSAWIAYWAERFAVALNACEDNAVGLFWALPRTQHWTATAVEDAGWKIRDVITHHFGHPWPKDKNALKPASEAWILAVKGKPALGIDACRVERGGESTARPSGVNTNTYGADDRRGMIRGGNADGSWPTNLVLSHFSSEWYALRDDIDESTFETVCAYYGIGEALRALRGGVPGDAGRTSETTFLQSGVRWRQQAREAQDGMDRDDVPGLRQVVSGDPGMVSERAQALLREDVPVASAHAISSWDPSFAGVSRDYERQGEGEESAGEVVAVEGRSCGSWLGLHLGDDRDLARGGSKARAGDAPSEAIHFGTSSRGGSNAGEAVASDRSGSPHQRDQVGQSPGEPGDARSRSALDSSPGGREGGRSASHGERGASCRTGRLEVERERIPDGWLGLFEFIGAESCRPCGARKVRGSAPASGPTLTGASTSSARGKFNGTAATPSYGGDDQTETVPAYLCAVGCDCGRSWLAESGGEAPRCECGLAGWWACPIAQMDAESGQSISPGKTGRGAGGGKGAYSKIGAQGTVSCPADAGGASRFFPRFASYRVDSTQSHARTSVTQGDDAWEETATRADLCSCQSEKSNDFATTDAPAAESLGNEVRSVRLMFNAVNAENTSETLPATDALHVQRHALLTREEPSAQSAEYAGNRAPRCETASAPSGAATDPGQTPDSRVGWDSISGHGEPTLIRCRACGAVRLDRSGITKTTQSRNTSNGFAQNAISTSITSVSHEEREFDPIRLQSRMIYAGKAPSGERHAGCENLFWRADKKDPFGFVRVTHEEWEALDPKDRAEGNVHATVKRLSLMRWLHALTGAKRIGDLCGGSGSGMVAAYLDGLDWIGAEVCPHAIGIANARLAFWKGLSFEARERFLSDDEMPVAPKVDERQVSLF